MIDTVREYWDSRADLGYTAGGPDTVLKQLEMQAIERYVRDGMRVLDAGCGNGVTAIELANQHSITIVGLDYSARMIAAAQKAAGAWIDFRLGDVLFPHPELGLFDLVYTERTIINLPNWAAQERAIRNLMDLVAPGGTLLLCEACEDGLIIINQERQHLGLPAIIPPFHNRYIRSGELAHLGFAGPMEFTSTYYLLSRIVNAALARDEGRTPDYSDPINQLALRLPSIGSLGQCKLWTWRPT